MPLKPLKKNKEAGNKDEIKIGPELIEEIVQVPEGPPSTPKEEASQKKAHAQLEEIKQPAAPAPPTLVTPAIKESALKQVESILELGLLDVYKSMDDDLKVEFKAEGERIALKIRKMIELARLKAKKILRMISRWLAMIPGVNKFFLEQESKIKTDQLMALAERKEEIRK